MIYTGTLCESVWQNSPKCVLLPLAPSPTLARRDYPVEATSKC